MNLTAWARPLAEPAKAPTTTSVVKARGKRRLVAVAAVIARGGFPRGLGSTSLWGRSPPTPRLRDQPLEAPSCPRPERASAGRARRTPANGVYTSGPILVDALELQPARPGPRRRQWRQQTPQPDARHTTDRKTPSRFH